MSTQSPNDGLIPGPHTCCCKRDHQTSGRSRGGRLMTMPKVCCWRHSAASHWSAFSSSETVGKWAIRPARHHAAQQSRRGLVIREVEIQSGQPTHIRRVARVELERFLERRHRLRKVARCSFIAVDSHHLRLAGLPAHLCENSACAAPGVFARHSQSRSIRFRADFISERLGN